MDVIISDTPDEAARVAAHYIADVMRQVRSREDRSPVLGVATGSSPLGTYAELARLVSAGELDVTGVSAFALDEYAGLAEEHPESYHAVIHRSVTEPLGLEPGRVHVPDGLAADLAAGCLAYEEAIAAEGGIDVQLLGIGANGHIGFNEPGSPFDSRTHVSHLTGRTRADNARFFESPEQVPHSSVTQGIGTILDARRVVLIALGEAKAEAIAAAVEGPASEACPASALQLHPNALVVVDRAAASKLQGEYSRTPLLVGADAPQIS